MTVLSSATVAYDRSDAREQRRNELAERLAEARKRAGHRTGGDWRGAVAPLFATLLLWLVGVDAILVMVNGRAALFPRVVAAYEAVQRVVPLSMLNDPPIATGAAELTTAGPVQLILTGQDPEGDPLSVRIVRPPAHGELVVPNDASAPLVVEYRPTAGFSGDDVLTFVVSDGVHDSAEMSRPIRVYAPPEPPSSPPTATRTRVESTRIADFDPDDFDPDDPTSWRSDQVTPEYIRRAQQILDGQPQSQRGGRPPGARRERDAPPSLTPPLIPNAELERGAR
ncbi:MAG: hypothetical protein OHK0013_34050 [Sandaracinaceae bacterium]